MAQNRPQGHQGGTASDDGHSAPPPTTVSFSLMTSAGGSSSSVETMDAAGGMGKQNLIRDLNIEDGMGKLNVGHGCRRRKKLKDQFRALRDIMPHVPRKTDRVALMGEAIKYITVLRRKVALLRMQKRVREAAAFSSASFSLAAMPQTAQGMAALGGVPVPPATPTVPASPIRFRTWSGPNVVLTVSNDNAYISLRAPPRANTQSTVMSVLDNHGIDVVNGQISSNNVRTLFLLFAHVNGINGVNTSPEEVYKRAVSEIMLRLNSN